MSSELVLFDYSAIDGDTKEKLIWLGGDINRHKLKSVKSILDMGQAMHDAQVLLARHGTGSFGKWIEAECGIAHRTAYNYINAWRRFNDCESLSQFSCEAMYVLGSPKTPEDAVAEAERLAASGVKVDAKTARALSKEGKDDEPADKKKIVKGFHNQPGWGGGRDWGEGDSLTAVQADLEEFSRRCRKLSQFARRILRCKKDEITRPYCGEYSLTTLSHPLLHVARVVHNDMPVGGTPKQPVLFHEEKAKSLA